VRSYGLLQGRQYGAEGRRDVMMALWSPLFCPCDGRRVSLGDLSAAHRYTTQQADYRFYAQHRQICVQRHWWVCPVSTPHCHWGTGSVEWEWLPIL